MIIAPFIPLAIIAAIAKRAIIPIRAPWLRSNASVVAKFTRVAPSSCIQPISLSPIMARNAPIPAPVAIFRSLGIALIILVLQPTCGIEMTRKIIPSMKTAARATCQSIPMPSTTAKVKYALSPIPGASANGRFAHRPITTQPTNAAIAVANNASSKGIPATDSIAGFTRRMYAIVRNVVTPARISEAAVTPFALNPNVLSNMLSTAVIFTSPEEAS